MNTLLSTGAFLLCISGGPSQSQTSQLHVRPTGSEGLRVTLDVNVAGRGDAAIAALRTEDFEVFDNNVPLRLDTLQQVSGAQATAQILLVVDAINTSHENLARTEDAIRSFLWRDGGHLLRPVSILVLTDTEPQLTEGTKQDSDVMALHGRQAFVRRIPASQDGLVLVKAMDQSLASLSRILEAQGGEGESERVSLSLQALNFIATAERDVPGRKVVVWISPGWPLLAHSNAKTREQLFDSIVYFSGLLRDARITLNMVDPNGAGGRQTVSEMPPAAYVNGSVMRGGPVPVLNVTSGPTAYMAYLKGISQSRQADINDLALQVLADHTGGQVLIQNNGIESQIASCAAEAVDFYSLTYTLPATTGATTYHRLELRVKRPGAVVHAPAAIMEGRRDAYAHDWRPGLKRMSVVGLVASFVMGAGMMMAQAVPVPAGAGAQAGQQAPLQLQKLGDSAPPKDPFPP